MTSTLRSCLQTGVALALATLVWSPPGAMAEPASDAPRPTMRRVFDEITLLLPLSLDSEKWMDPAERATILASLDRLERAASELEKHGRSREAGFDQLALNLSGDLREVSGHYRAGAYDEARFFLTGSLQSCIGCHVRLPTARSFPLAEPLLENPAVQNLDARERAWLYVTVRRFDAALATWEALMRDPSTTPSELDASGVLVDYLSVVLRVRADLPRANRALVALSERPDLPAYLALRIRSWRQALDALDPKDFASTTPPSLERGAALAQEAGQLAQGPRARDGLVQDLLAASQLVRWLEMDRARRIQETRNTTPSEASRTAQAYYWLGMVESRSLDGFWVHLSERHLEASIRADPKGPYAESAYAELEETQVLGYGGASGDYLPADVWTNLRDLRTLMGLE